MDRRTVLQSILSCLGLSFVGERKREQHPSTYVTGKLITRNCGQVTTYPIALGSGKKQLVYPFWAWTYCFMDYKTHEVRQIRDIKKVNGQWIFLLGHAIWEFEENSADVSHQMELLMRERLPPVRKEILGPCGQLSDEWVLNGLIQHAEG